MVFSFFKRKVSVHVYYHQLIDSVRALVLARMLALAALTDAFLGLEGHVCYRCGVLTGNFAFSYYLLTVINLFTNCWKMLFVDF